MLQHWLSTQQPAVYFLWYYLTVFSCCNHHYSNLLTGKAHTCRHLQGNTGSPTLLYHCAHEPKWPVTDHTSADGWAIKHVYECVGEPEAHCFACVWMHICMSHQKSFCHGSDQRQTENQTVGWLKMAAWLQGMLPGDSIHVITLPADRPQTSFPPSANTFWVIEQHK